MKRISKLLLPVTAIGLFFGGWTLASYFLAPTGENALVVLPSPVVVFEDLISLFREQEFVQDIAISVLRILLGIGCSAIPAFIVGLTFGLNPGLYKAFSPLFAFAKYVPPVSLIPILIVWIGIGLGQQIAVIFIGTFFYLTVMVAETVASTPQTCIDAARTLGANPRQLVWHVYIKNGLPAFIEHIRTMLGIAWTYLVAVEMVATTDGIGRVIINSQRYLQTGKVLAGIITIGFLGILLDEFLQWIKWFSCRWNRKKDPPILARMVLWFAGIFGISTTNQRRMIDA